MAQICTKTSLLVTVMPLSLDCLELQSWQIRNWSRAIGTGSIDQNHQDFKINSSNIKSPGYVTLYKEVEENI
jgi:hypothetical protein